jgi:hypothetical protein
MAAAAGNQAKGGAVTEEHQAAAGIVKPEPETDGRTGINECE